MLRDGLRTILYHNDDDNDVGSVVVGGGRDSDDAITLVNLTPGGKGEEDNDYNYGNDDDADDDDEGGRHRLSADRRISPKDVIRDLKERDLLHVMVEGGLSTALAFLEERMIDRVIIIQPPVTFRKTLGLGMSDEILDKAGLTKLGVEICRDNTVHYWTRKERDLSHLMAEGGLSTALAFLEERMIDRGIIIR